MQRFIARQPIFDRMMHVSGYELLYRTGGENCARVADGNWATRNLLSDAMMVFGLRNLTGGRAAYVNFTEQLLLDDFVLMARPREVVVEVLETVKVTRTLIERLDFLKKRAYTLALDDYTGDPVFEPILPYIDVLKVDFMLTDAETQAKIAARFRRGRMTLLAEKVEDRETLDRAMRLGYSAYQGYFFERPTMLHESAPETNTVAYFRLLRELNDPDVSLMNCAQIIRTDADLTLRLLKSVHTLRYYRGNFCKAIEQAVVHLGIDRLYHWTVLTLARDANRSTSSETVREAYLRGVFAERLLENTVYANQKTLAFMVGMFSLMDRIMDEEFTDIFQDISIPSEVSECLVDHKEGLLKHLLEFVTAYVRGSPIELQELDADPEDVMEIYVASVKETDSAFDEEE